MFFNFFIFVAAASVFSGITIAENETPPSPQVPGNLGAANNITTLGSGPLTQNSTKETENQSPKTNNVTDSAILKNTTEESKNISQSTVNQKNNVTNINITADSNVVVENNKTANNITANVNTINNAANKTIDNIVAKENNNTANVNNLDNNTVNKTTDNQQNTTAHIDSGLKNNTEVAKNVTNQNIKPNVPDKNGGNSTAHGKETPPVPAQQSTQGNVSSTGIHINDTAARINPNELGKKNVTEASKQPSTINSGVPRWKAILITAAVVVAGCFGVLFVRRSLRSERGQAFLQRTRRQANMPCRDYEVQYLVIRDNDD